MSTPTDRPPVCDYEGSDYQQRFWEQGGRAYEDGAEAVALRRLLPREGGKLLLEIGAGAGRNTPRYYGYRRVVLLDYSRTQLRQAQQRLGRSDRYVYVAADAYHMPFADGLFDGATMIRTLHHMAEPLKVLQETRRVMLPGAVFILEFANKRNLKAILRWLLRRQDWNPFTPEPVEFAALNFDFHPRQVFAWLNEAGFEVEAIRTVSHFRMGLLKRTIPTKVLVAMDALAQPTGRWWQLTPSVFVRSRVRGAAVASAGEVVFRCPACGHSPLEPADDHLACPACGARWAVRDGIYDFKEPL